MIPIIRTGLDAANKEIATISNNIANAGAVGFKRSTAEFVDIYNADVNMRPDLDLGMGSTMTMARRNHSQGSFQTTNGSLDMAIEGEGMFVFGTDDGTGGTVFSRNGALQLDEKSRVVNSFGQPLLQVDGSAITIPLMIIDANGKLQQTDSITTDNKGIINVAYSGGFIRQVGRVALARFTNPTEMKALGNNQFQPSAKSGLPAIGNPGERNYGRITSGALERANVDIADEMSMLIRAQQAFSGSSRMLQADADITRRIMDS